MMRENDGFTRKVYGNLLKATEIKIINVNTFSKRRAVVIYRTCAARCPLLCMPAIPFQTIDRTAIPKTEHKGETGTACWQTLQLDGLRLRLVEYAAGYLANHTIFHQIPGAILPGMQARYVLINSYLHIFFKKE
jgi:hypothetical protein